MPRDGSGVYSRPVGTDAVTDTTIESTKYNVNVADVEQDLNQPRPIVAGGTGATSADAALTNLSAEKAAQIITNWDSMLWMPGSFYAASSATGTAPVTGHAFSGICYINEPLVSPPTNQNVILEARDLDAVLSTPLWLNSTLYLLGTLARDGVDNPNTVWKATSDHTSSAGPTTFAQARAANPTLWTAVSVIPATKYTRIKRAGVWSAWSVENTQTVRYDTVQILTASEQTQARKNIYAAPVDALNYNGMQINGSIEVSQEFGIGGSGALGAVYFCDGWASFKAGSMVGNAFVAGTGVPSFFPGFKNCIGVTISTAQTVLGANDVAQVYQYIEGYRVMRLAWGTANAQPLTIGFWCCHNRPGLYSGAIRTPDGARSCIFSYTQNTANTSEYKTVTIPGCTDGIWTIDNTKAVYINFLLAGGTSTLAPSAGVWYTNFNSYCGLVGQVNSVASTTDIFRLTGVVILPGVEAPTAARSTMIMRPYDQELLMCQRYYWQLETGQSFAGYAATGGAAFGSVTYPIMMRATPAVSFPGAVSNYLVNFLATSTVSNNPPSIPTTTPTTVRTSGIQFNTPAVLTAGQGVILITSGTSIKFDARM